MVNACQFGRGIASGCLVGLLMMMAPHLFWQKVSLVNSISRFLYRSTGLEKLYKAEQLWRGIFRKLAGFASVEIAARAWLGKNRGDRSVMEVYVECRKL